MDDIYIYLIVALLPISALMLMLQVDPYQALVIRGILGAIAVFSYIILGAADVALTEALMGTMLGVALYIVAVRSSFVMRLGIIDNPVNHEQDNPDFSQLKKYLQQVISKVYLRLELISYGDEETLKNALKNKEVHSICNSYKNINGENYYKLTFRVKRLFDLFNSKNNPNNLNIIYKNRTDKLPLSSVKLIEH